MSNPATCAVDLTPYGSCRPVSLRGIGKSWKRSEGGASVWRFGRLNQKKSSAPTRGERPDLPRYHPPCMAIAMPLVCPCNGGLAGGRYSCSRPRSRVISPWVPLPPSTARGSLEGDGPRLPVQIHVWLYYTWTKAVCKETFLFLFSLQ